MMLIDANLVLHAYNPRAREHEASRRWLEDAFSGPDPVGLPWLVVWAFLRIMTNPRVFEHPLSLDEAVSIVQSWLAQPAVTILEPGERHSELLAAMLRQGQASGPLVMDAVLAALAIEHGATLYTTDRDFARFPGLRWVNPLEPGSES